MTYGQWFKEHPVNEIAKWYWTDVETLGSIERTPQEYVPNEETETLVKAALFELPVILKTKTLSDKERNQYADALIAVALLNSTKETRKQWAHKIPLRPIEELAEEELDELRPLTFRTLTALERTCSKMPKNKEGKIKPGQTLKDMMFGKK